MRFLFVLVGLMALGFLAVPLWWLFVGAMHWVVIGLVIWAAMSLLRGPRRRGRWERAHNLPRPPQRERAGVREPVRPQPVSRQPATTSNPLPLDVQVKVEQIRRKAEVLLQQRDRFPFGSEDLYMIRATRDDYLPRTLDAYLAVPSAQRERSMPSGKTPLQELKEQLRLLDTKLDEVAEDLQRRNFDRLLANRRFLEHRFGRPPVSV